LDDFLRMKYVKVAPRRAPKAAAANVCDVVEELIRRSGRSLVEPLTVRPYEWALLIEP